MNIKIVDIGYMLTVMVLLVFFSYKIFVFRYIFLDSSVRASVQNITKILAAEEGFLLSGMKIQSVSRDEVQLCYREYKKGKDDRYCFTRSL